MRRITLVLLMLLVAGVLLSGCGTPPTTPEGVKLYTEAGVDPDSWALVPAGEFLMGQYNDPVMIDYDYEIMVTHVTNAQYAQFLEEALAAGEIKIENGNVMGYYPGDKFQDGRHELKVPEGDYVLKPIDNIASRIKYENGKFTVKEGYENHPVAMVSWFGAHNYADFYGYRLPTEKEWEKAARGTEDDRPYPWGDEITAANANYYRSGGPFQTKDTGYSDTTPVGFFNGQKYGDFQTINSPSPYGLYDMAGNVSDWMGDNLYQHHDRRLKGGNKDYHAIDARIWKVNSAPPEHVSPAFGFRCVRDLQ